MKKKKDIKLHPAQHTARYSDGKNAGKKGRRKKKRRKHLKWQCAVLLAAAACLAASAGVTLFAVRQGVYRECIVEAGVTVTAADFLKKEGREASFEGPGDGVDTSKPGSYPLRVKTGMFTHSVTLIVQDTKPPSAEPVEQTIQSGEKLQPEDFVRNISDATQVSVRFGMEPDFSRFGRQQVSILLEDEGGNQATVQSGLIVSKVKAEVVVEAGAKLPRAEEFLVTEAGSCAIREAGRLDTGTAGITPVGIEVDGELYESSLAVVDTIPPEAKVQDLEGFTPAGRKAEEFIVPDSILDATEVTVSYKEEPDMTKEGTQTVTILLTDGGGNTAQKEAALTLSADREKPVIRGAVDLTAICGYGVSYKKNVRVTDNSGEDIELKVDASAVDLGQVGSYPVIYTATDLSGNEARVEVTLEVREKTFDVEELYAKADEVLAEITTEEMSDYDKAYAIFNWVKRNVMYVDHASKDIWEQGAYDGLIHRKGDCYTYAMTAKLLLTQAGIENQDMAKIPTSSKHYWNAVNLGDGWLHFDATPRTDHSIIFLWTDEQLTAYMGRHYRSHNYDRSIYTIFDEDGATVSPSDSYEHSIVAEAKAAQQKAEEEAAALEAEAQAQGEAVPGEAAPDAAAP